MATNHRAVEIGKRLRSARGAAGLSVKALGRASQVSTGTVSRIENGKGIPDLLTSERLAEALGISVAGLLGIEVPESSADPFIEGATGDFVRAVQEHRAMGPLSLACRLYLLSEADARPDADIKEWRDLIAGCHRSIKATCLGELASLSVTPESFKIEHHKDGGWSESGHWVELHEVIRGVGYMIRHGTSAIPYDGKHRLPDDPGYGD